jgi:hypothetical protein
MRVRTSYRTPFAVRRVLIWAIVGLLSDVVPAKTIGDAADVGRVRASQKPPLWRAYGHTGRALSARELFRRS